MVYLDGKIEVTPAVIKAECERIQRYAEHYGAVKNIPEEDFDAWEAVVSLMETAVFMIDNLEELHTLLENQ